MAKNTNYSKGPWTQHERECLIEWHGSMTTAELSKKLNRPVGGINYQISQLRSTGWILEPKPQMRSIMETTLYNLTDQTPADNEKKSWWQFWK